MHSTTRLTTILRTAAAITAGATLATWVATGAHVGWTQTSAIAMQHDEITGIEYPVRHDVFVVGVEVLGIGIGIATVLGGLSLLPRRRLATA